MNESQLIFVSTCIIALSVVCGCEPPTSKTADRDSHSHSHGDQTHSHRDHSHGNTSAENSNSSHAHGPNGGHLFDFEPNDFVGEWTQARKSDLIKLFILDADGKAIKPVQAESVIVNHGDSIFSLDPEHPDDSQPNSMFTLEDQELAIAVNLGVTVEMKIGDQTFVGKIEPSRPHKH